MNTASSSRVFIGVSRVLCIGTAKNDLYHVLSL